MTVKSFCRPKSDFYYAINSDNVIYMYMYDIKM